MSSFWQGNGVAMVGCARVTEGGGLDCGWLGIGGSASTAHLCFQRVSMDYNPDEVDERVAAPLCARGILPVTCFRVM